MAWLLEGGKKFEDTFIRFDTIHERDGHTHGQGRRHGFESKGDNFASGASKKIFDPPTF